MHSIDRISKVQRAAAFLNVLGNSKRLDILKHLMQSELPVNVIADRVGLSQSALSQHLAKLRSHGLVETRRDRQLVYYSCSSKDVSRLFGALDDIFQ